MLFQGGRRGALKRKAVWRFEGKKGPLVERDPDVQTKEGGGGVKTPYSIVSGAGFFPLPFCSHVGGFLPRQKNARREWEAREEWETNNGTPGKLWWRSGRPGMDFNEREISVR